MSEIRWEGPDDLRELLVAIDEVQTHPENPRRGNLDVVEESLRVFGQQRPVVVQAETGHIVAGNHVYRAATERLGWSHVAAVRSPLDAADAVRYLLMDNRASDLGTYDDEVLVRILSELAELGELTGTGYTADDYDALVAQANEIADSYADDAPPEPRTDDAGDGAVMKEVVLMLEPEQYAAFGNRVRVLRREYGADTVTATVFEAVRREAERVRTEQPA